jgi:hypothetical protein
MLMKSINTILTSTVFALTLAACGGGGDDDDGDGATSSPTNPDITASHQVLAFNDLGMHCADLDYSVFSILPPYNVLHAQVIERGATPRILDISGVEVSYRGVADAAGSINTTSQNQAGGVWKTNFWDTNPATGNSYAFDLFGLDPVPDEGLLFGQRMPGISDPYTANVAQTFSHYDPNRQWFAADGIPIMPIDDFGQTNTYPLMRISAVDQATATNLANLDVVVPVAAEADCQNCHASAQDRDNYPDPADLLNAAKRNILGLHDAEHGTDLASNTPVLCASCHYSAALDLAGDGPVGEQVGNPTMSNVMHEFHGLEADFPSDSMEDTCYQCHPGKQTQCLRGAMGSAGMDCVDCHGGMLAVGNPDRQPWLDEPRCESCHTGNAVDNLAGEPGTVVNAVDVEGNVDGIRLRQAWLEGDSDATPIMDTGSDFAEDPGELYRNSLGHGGVACEACHGSTHAIWPTTKANDNQAAIDLQGYSGTITECGVCHTSVPLNLEGPHGMHVVDSDAWDLQHGDLYEDNLNACRACHGVNLEGTVLSRAASDRVYLRNDDGATISVAKGTPISCTLCHGMPD